MMDEQRVEILQALRGHARQRGWTQVVGVTERLLDEPSVSTIPLAAGNGIETAALRSWLAAQVSNSAVEPTSLEALSEDPLPTLQADRALAVFECGTVPDSAALDALASGFFGRPVDSYAVVLSRAERIQTPEDLEMVERMAWRLLIPGPQADWNHQRLAEHGIYLWSDRPVADFLAERVQADAAVLVRWLGTAEVFNEQTIRELEQQRVLYVLNLAAVESERCQYEAEAAQRSSISAQQLFAIQEAMIDLRRRVLKAVSADAAALEKALMVSLQTLRQELRDKLQPHLAQLKIPHSPVTNNGKWLEQILNAYIFHGIESWQNRAREHVSTWSHTLERDIRTAVESMDWSLVNRVAEQSGQPADYPETLYRHHSLIEKIEDESSRSASVSSSDLTRLAGTGFQSGMAIVRDERIGEAVLVRIHPVKDLPALEGSAEALPIPTRPAAPRDKAYLYRHAGCCCCPAPGNFYYRFEEAQDQAAMLRALDPFLESLFVGEVDGAWAQWSQWRAHWQVQGYAFFNTQGDINWTLDKISKIHFKSTS